MSKKTELSENQQPAPNEEDAKVLKSISPFRVALPVLIGLAVVIYFFISEFNAEEFSKIEWTGTVVFWIFGAAFFMAFRHFCYMVRLRTITNGFFSWRKCFELVMMWEFSSAVTPTSVGGAAVAMFAIAQEKLPGGKTAMIVLYTVVIDTFFFLTALMAFFLIFGSIMIQPGAYTMYDLFYNPPGDINLGVAFLIAYLLMLTYGSLFFYGVLINSKGLQRVLLWFCKFRLFKRFADSATKMTDDMSLASGELRNQNWKFHLITFLSTGGAWISRFMVLNCLIIGFVAHSSGSFDKIEKQKVERTEVVNGEQVTEVVTVRDTTPTIVGEHYNKLMVEEHDYNIITQHTFIYARQQAMYVIMAVLPTPGGAGAAEWAFQQFHNDYLPTGGTLLVILTIIWRFFTYYVYLFVGAIVVPNWVRKLINRRKEEALQNATNVGDEQPKA